MVRGLKISDDANAKRGVEIFHYVPTTGEFKTLSGTTFPNFGFDPSAPNGKVTANGKIYGLYSVYEIGGSGLFEADLDGSNLHLFARYNTTRSGGTPTDIVLASDGNLWVADQVGSNSNGDLIALSLSEGTVVRRLTPFGPSSAVGANPATLLQVNDGTFWGTTIKDGMVSAGHFGDGVVFRLNAGLPPQ
jgi:hypothetical protein